MSAQSGQRPALPGMWEFLGEVLRLAWDCRWALLCAIAVYAACIWAFVGVLPSVRALPSQGIDSVLGYGPPALFAILAFTLPTAIVLHAAGNRAMGMRVTCFQSCVAAVLCQPRMLVFAAMAGGSFMLLWHLLFRTNRTADRLLGLLSSGFEITSPWPLAPFALFIATYFLIVPLVALLVVVRAGALAPAYIVLDGCGVISAWKASFRSMSRRYLIGLVPYLAPLFFSIALPWINAMLGRHRWMYEEVLKETVILSAFVILFVSAALVPLWRHAHLSRSGGLVGPSPEIIDE